MSPMPDSTLADPQQIIAELQRQLAECRAERDEARQQQTATAEVLQVINSSPGELAPVFDAMLEKALHLCEAAFGLLHTYDGERFRGLAVGGMSGSEAEPLREWVADPGSALERMVHGDRVVHIPDVVDTDAYRSGVASRLKLVKLTGARTALWVALRKDDALLGVFVIYRREVRPFSDKQIALLQNFAAQAVIAMENARLLTETREALEQQTATAEVLRVINSSPADLTPVFEAILDKAHVLCGATLGTLFRYDGEKLRAAATLGYPEDLANELRRGVGVFPNSGPAALLAGARLVHRPDITQVGDPVARAVSQRGGVRTNLLVPLRKDGAFLGMISCNRKEVRPYTDKEIALIENFAAQAVIAMENARLIGETREALEQQTATAEVLQVINSSPGNLAPVFDAMLEKAMQLCGAAFGVLQNYNGRSWRTEAAHGVPPAYAEFRRNNPPAYSHPGTGPARLLAGERVVHIVDLKAEDAYSSGDPNRRALVDLGGARTSLHVALVRDERVCGCIQLYNDEVRPFSQKQIALLENFAAQAVIAMENARLLGELQQRTGDLQELLEYQTATSDVLNVISRSTFDLQPVLDTLAETAARLCDAGYGAIYRRDGEVYRIATAVAFSPETKEAARKFRAFVEQHPLVPNRGTITGRVALGRQAVHVADTASDPEYRLSEATTLGNLRTQLGVPLLREGEPIGVIALARQRVEPFTKRQVELVQTFADQAVVAMENTRLLGELQQRTGDLQELLEYQTATSDVLKVISRSTFDLQPVLDTLVETATRLCNADGSAIAMREGEVYRYVAMYATYGIDEYYNFMRQRTFKPGRDTTIGRVALDGKVVHIADIAADPEYALPESSSVGKIRTNLGVPLLRDGAVVGMLTLIRQRVEPFTERQVELVQTFADQAVVAIENARLLGELQQRTEELTRSVGELQALEEVARAVNSSLDLDTVLATVIGRAVLLSQADEGTIYEFDETEEVFVPKSAFGMSAEQVEALRERRIKLGETHLGRSAIERAPVYVADVQQDPSVPHAARTLPGIHAVLAVPLLREDKVVGGLVIRRRSGDGFAPTIATLMQTFAGQAVLAIENARLFQELAARGEEARRAHAAAEAALADLRRAQDRLIQAEKMASLGQLTAGIAHEIKNPLNFVNNFAGLSVELLDELKEAAAPALAALDGDKLAEVNEIVAMLTGNLEKIAEHGRRADGIVKSMLEHSRGESGERRPVDLNNLVEEALNLAYHGARAQDQAFNITLERDFAAAIAPIELVPQDVTRVLLNLIGNGFYAATKRLKDGAEPNFRPTLKVTTRDLGEAVEIRVRDNGAGIMPEIRDKLFQPFFTTKPTGEGTGLGLSISYDIVTQQHGGTIAVDSRVGEFTEFAIHLPRTRGTAPTATTTIDAVAASMTA